MNKTGSANNASRAASPFPPDGPAIPYSLAMELTLARTKRPQYAMRIWQLSLKPASYGHLPQQPRREPYF